MKKLIALLLTFIMLLMVGCTVPGEKIEDNVFYFPAEEDPHEGTWIA